LRGDCSIFTKKVAVAAISVGVLIPRLAEGINVVLDGLTARFKTHFFDFDDGAYSDVDDIASALATMNSLPHPALGVRGNGAWRWS